MFCSYVRWTCDLKRLQIFLCPEKVKAVNPFWFAVCCVIWRNSVSQFQVKSFTVMAYINELARDLPNIELIEGFPNNLYELIEGHDGSLIVLDDLMSQCSNDQRVSDLFTRGSHHGISVLYLTQNLFPPGKLSRAISLNSHYMVIFRNPRDSLGISTLAKQMFPKHINYLMEAFDDATSKPYEYLMIDCHQLTPENMRLRTNILLGERQIVCARRS